MTSRIEVRHTGTSKGRGVFAREPIAAGSTIEIVPVLVIPARDKELVKRTVIYNYFFEWGSKGDTAVALGFGSLYNHSDAPNARHVRDFLRQEMRFVALVDIADGDEIQINYNGDYDGRRKDKSVWFDDRGASVG